MEEKQPAKRNYRPQGRYGGIFLLLMALGCFLFWYHPVSAQNLDTGIEFGQYTGLADTDIRIIVAKIIRAFLGIVGLVALGFTLYGGYLYMTSEGNEEKVATAKKILKNMVIGLAIILSALAITQFIINMLYGQYKQGGEGVPPIGSDSYCPSCGFLGSVIESHYPPRNATGIPRNTKIVVTFKHKIKPETLINDANGNKEFGDTKGADVGNNDTIKAENIKIFPTEQKEAVALKSEEANIFLAADQRTIVIKPKNYLGNPDTDTNYTVKLDKGVQLADGKDAFGAIGSYSWSFTVSTFVDLEPPRVESVFPIPSAQKYPRNAMVQVNFNEPVDPISASGVYNPPENFQNIKAESAKTGAIIPGEYRLVNQYRTVEFKTFDQCGVNPCGQPIFCLPGNTSVTTTVKSASVDPTNLPQAKITTGLYDGVVDMAGNSLNGGGELKINENGKIVLAPGIKTKAQWQEDKDLDDFYWKILTSAVLDTTAPKIKSISPDFKMEGVGVGTPLFIIFSKPMSMSTFGDIILRTNKIFNVWYTPAGHNLKADGTPVKLGEAVDHTQAELLHGDFWQKPPNPQAEDEKINAIYYPFVPSSLNDLFQNCFYPAEDAASISSECVKGEGGKKLNDANPSCSDDQ
ncbi:MAG: Ig-like domain-containing protein, partial [Candidatus Magasanikbacteria bacterium]|nr:Ig-like domain-containing protein [Candidatus Magasanikbacteria bacterium]